MTEGVGGVGGSGSGIETGGPGDGVASDGGGRGIGSSEEGGVIGVVTGSCGEGSKGISCEKTLDWSLASRAG